MVIQKTALLLFIVCFSCSNNKKEPAVTNSKETVLTAAEHNRPIADTNRSDKAIHVFVALCDNKYQGIVPVPAGIGNGQNAATNLYWGAGYGVNAYFKKSKEWQFVSYLPNPSDTILQRSLFKHRSKNIYLLADAYDGKYIKQTTVDFFRSAAGGKEVKIKIPGRELFFGGASDLIAYVGHDGLMDFKLTETFEKTSARKREAIVLACYSKNYFSSLLKPTGTVPLVWTTGLMAPEAYTLHDAINVWANKGSSSAIQQAAANAYSKYQKCSVKAASRLLVTGW